MSFNCMQKLVFESIVADNITNNKQNQKKKQKSIYTKPIKPRDGNERRNSLFIISPN